MSLANHPGNVEVVYYVDDDDDSYNGLNLDNTTRVSDQRILLSEMRNACADAARGVSHATMCDDMLCRTEGWDERSRTAFQDTDDKRLFVYCDDGSTEYETRADGIHGWSQRT